MRSRPRGKSARRSARLFTPILIPLTSRSLCPHTRRGSGFFVRRNVPRGTLPGRGEQNVPRGTLKTPRSKPRGKRKRPAPVGHMPPTPTKMNGRSETRQGMAAADRGRGHSVKRKAGPMLNGGQGYTSIHRKRKRPEQGGHDRQRRQGRQRRKFPGVSSGEKAHSSGGTEVARATVCQRLRRAKQGKGPSGKP